MDWIKTVTTPQSKISKGQINTDYPCTNLIAWVKIIKTIERKYKFNGLDQIQTIQVK